MTKYGNKKITLDGITFDSMLEGAFYQRLKDYKKAGKIQDFAMQVPFVLHAGIKYKLDFLIYQGPPTDPLKWKTRAVEVKGFWTQTAKLKKKLFEADFGKLEIHTRDRPWSLEPNIVASKPTKRPKPTHG